jgi:membrane fusion protein (multidrug efflux system)
MSDQPHSSPEKSPPPSKEELKKEILQEIARAIQESGGGNGREGSPEKAPGGKDKKEGEKKGQEEKDKGAEPKKKFQWTPLKILLIAVVAVVILVVAISYFTYAAHHETTDDAYTTGYVHQISSRVTSNVTELLVQDNEHVVQGQVLLKLDPRDFIVAVARAEANYENAKADYDRVEPLRNDVAISKQDFDQSATNLRVAKANLDDARNQLSYCTVVAPTDGFIGNRTVNTGNRVTVGGALMAVVQDVWIVANYKETQIGKMRRNQVVDITVDAIPGKKFVGHIDSFSPGTGSTFALLPPDNATGNFTKIVQRVPVKIVFDPESIRDFRSRLLPGLSVETSTVLDENVRPTPDQADKMGP